MQNKNYDVLKVWTHLCFSLEKVKVLQSDNMTIILIRGEGGPQWAKLGGQAMQLDKALNFEDFGWAFTANATSLWWNKLGEGRD